MDLFLTLFCLIVLIVLAISLLLLIAPQQTDDRKEIQRIHRAAKRSIDHAAQDYRRKMDRISRR